MKTKRRNTSEIAVTLTALAVLGLLASPAGAQNAASTAAPAAAASSTASINAPPTTHLQQVIVTGTILRGVTEQNSAAPILVLSGSALEKAGTQNIQQSLQQTVPGFFMTHVGGDLANLTRSANLLGLSPNDTLVMVNGKRRNNTAMIDADGNGASAPDLTFIPAAAISNVQVLRIGDATLYGSGAVAGVVNLILKHSSSGGSISLTGGQYYSGGPFGDDGQTYSLAVNKGLPLGKHGFINLTFTWQYDNYHLVGGADSHLVTPDGQPKTCPYCVVAQSIKGYPYLNRISGTPRVRQGNFVVNSGYNITSNVQVYDFATYGTKLASAWENWRPPNETVASPVLGIPGTYGAPGAIVPYPQGFSPQEQINEVQFANTVGIKGTAGAWRWDLSSTYGQDKDRIYTNNTIVRSLFINTHESPNSFYDGSFTFSEWTNNLDIKRSFKILGAPSNVAFGVETRKDTYSIKQGEPLATYQEGPQGFPGYTAADAGRHTRTNTGGYVDLVTFPTPKLQIEMSGRAEHYSDFGSAVIGDFITRYDLTRRYAFRAAVQTGFRAPTLQEEYYTATNVDPNYADIVLPANSAGSRVLGYPQLKPIRSIEFSAGVVLTPLPHLHMTIDAYLLRINHVITRSPVLYCRGGAYNTPLVCDAIALNGNVIDPTAGDIQATTFVNGYDSKTEGVDWTLNYPLMLGQFGAAQLTFNGDYHDTSVRGVAQTPAVLLPIQLFEPFNISNLNDGYSKYTVKLGFDWRLRRWSATLWESAYGPQTFVRTLTGGPPFYYDRLPLTFLTDLQVDYRVWQSLSLDVGVRNLFNKKPPAEAQTPTGHPDQYADSQYEPIGSPYDPGGGYYYAGLTMHF